MRKLSLIIFLITGIGLWGETLPEWLIPLREAVYGQQLGVNEIRPLYEAAKAAAQAHCTGTALDTALSRCEYLMGRTLHFYERKQEAVVHYHEGMRLAEKALAAAPSSEGWLLRAENLSQACSIGPWSYTVANGLNVEKFAKNALAINSRSAAAQYLVAARWVFAPAPFNNIRRGIEMMQAILVNSDLEKDDYFNVYSAIGYGYLQQKKHADARPWLIKSLEIYPTNKFAAELLNTR